MKSFNGKELILALGVARPTGERKMLVDNFAGSAFFINGQGWIAACKHNVPELDAGKEYTCRYLLDDSIYPLTDIRRHSTLDLAVGRVDVKGGYLPPYRERILLGLGVCAMGLIKRGMHEGSLTVDIRYPKGYVTRVGPNDYGLPTGDTLLEVSFPSLTGFSGTPLLTEDTNHLVGMLYGNQRSHIEEFSRTDVAESGKETSESVQRIVEFGLAHPIDILEKGVTELGTWLGPRT